MIKEVHPSRTPYPDEGPGIFSRAHDAWENRRREPKYAIRRFGAAAAAAALFAGGIAGAKWSFTENFSVSEPANILPGDGGIKTVCDTVDILAEKVARDTIKGNEFDPNSGNCVYPGQDVNGELTRLYDVIPVGAPVEVTVSQNNIQDLFDRVSIEAHSAKQS